MSTRREFLTRTAASVVAATSTRISQATEDAAVPRLPVETQKKVQRIAGARIKSVIRREETVIRHGGVGDNFHMSWAADDRQYVSLCDGYGWSEKPKGLYNSCLFAIHGGPRDAAFQAVPGYPALMNGANLQDTNRYYNFGTLALDGCIYQFLSTPNHPFGQPDPHFVGSKLIYSADNGRTWRNQDGSTPVLWEPWKQRSPENMVFLEEPQNAFSLLTVLQMGKNYEANRDGYVYVYAPNGNTEGTMNELVMFRVEKSHILNRTAYEYFAGRTPGGGANWVKDLTARAVVHAFPRGWVNTFVHPFAWHPSVVYNGPLGLYMMTNWAPGNSPDGTWFGKPSYLGFWVAPNPWGPWAQIHEETEWLPAGDKSARAFAPQIAPKWVAADGKSFWLVWSDYQHQDKEALDRLREDASEKLRRNQIAVEDYWTQRMAMMRKHQPYYAFNVQRVDLLVA